MRLGLTGALIGKNVQNHECVQDLKKRKKEKKTALAVESVENSQNVQHLRSRAKLKIWTYTACVVVDTFSWVQTFSRVWNVLRQRQSLEIRRPPLPSRVKKRRQSE